jgi:pimeloyl-ACP methyl ester carboxylesterase
VKDILADLNAAPLPGGGRLWRSRDMPAGQPAILFVHGAYHGAWCFGGWMAALAKRGISVAAVDLPGHGGLPQPTDYANYGISDYGRCVQEAAARLDRPLAALGHSLGALVLSKAAETVDFAALCLVAPSPSGNVPGVAFVPPVPKAVPKQPPALAVYRKIYLAGSEVAAKWHPRLVAESPRALNERYGLEVAVKPRIPRGIVIEAGQEDAVRHPSGQDKALAAFYGYRHILLPDASHCMMLDAGGTDACQHVERWTLEELGRLMQS